MIFYDIKKTPKSSINHKDFYYVRISRSSVISFRNLKDRLSSKCTLSPSDISAVIEEISDMFVQSFQNGDSVHIDGLGNFSVRIQTSVTDSPQAINSSHIKVTGVVFRPESELVNRIQSKACFKRERSNSTLISKEEIILKLRDYLTEKNDNIFTCKEIQQLCNFTRSTTVRRLNELCDSENPIIKRMGRNNSGVYITTNAFKW